MQTKKKKKIAILKNNLVSQGGLEKYTFRLASYFQKKGLDVTLITTSDLKDLPFRVARLDNSSYFPSRRIKKFNQATCSYIKNNSFDLIFGMDRTTQQTHYRAGNGVHAHYLQQRKQLEPFLKRFSFSFNPLHRTLLNIEKQAYESKGLKVLFTNSHMVRKEVSKYYLVPPQKIQVVHNGVQWHEYAQAFNCWPQKQSFFKEKLGLSPTSYQFLFVGNGFERKGLVFIMQAMAKMKDMDFQLCVLGKDKYFHQFIKLRDKLGLKEKVIFFGPRSDVVHFYQIADACLVPSLYDPFANVTVEALAMGVFVISSIYNGGHEILNPQNGLIIENLFDIESIRQVMMEACNRRKTERSAYLIRQSVKHLDFSIQLEKIANMTLSSL